MSRVLLLRLCAAALFAGAFAWSMHQQAGYIIAAWSCGRAPAGVWISGAVAFAILLLGGWLSWRAFDETRACNDEPQPRRFLSRVALMTAAIFALALVFQVAAPFFLPGCVSG